MKNISSNKEKVEGGLEPSWENYFTRKLFNTLLKPEDDSFVIKTPLAIQILGVEGMIQVKTPKNYPLFIEKEEATQKEGLSSKANTVGGGILTSKTPPKMASLGYHNDSAF